MHTELWNISVYVVTIFSIVVVSIVTPLLLTKQRFQLAWWDYTSPFLGIPLWFMLRGFHVGGGISESNIIIEVFLVLMGAIFVPWLRFFLSFNKANALAHFSFFLTFVPAALPIFLRLTMPLLPE